MGREDMRRQALNVYKMGLLGAEVVPVDSGSATLKDATNEAIRDWVAHVRDTHYVIGSAVGPHPYPSLVRRLQRVIGDEARAQMLARLGRLPAVVVACVGGGSNAIGMFAAFLDDDVRLVGVEAAGRGLDSGAARGATLARTPRGAPRLAELPDAGRRRPGARHPFDQRRPRLSRASDRSTARSATADASSTSPRPMPRPWRRSIDLCLLEGIIPALESAHALHVAAALARRSTRPATWSSSV